MRSAKDKAALAEAVSHPLRVRILEILNEQAMSPADFVKGGFADFYFGHRPEVSHVAYHFRELAEFGCLEAVAWRKGRGTLATIYRGKASLEFGEDEWAALPEKEKRDISRTVAQGLVARMDGAFMSDTFLARDDHHLSWFAMRLDETGWNRVRDILADAYAAVSAERSDAEARLEEAGEEGVTATAAIVFFESPELTSLAEDDEPAG